jgi:hypothetical protein
MTMDAKIFHNKLSKMKHCDKVSGNETLQELVSLMFTPQGREFCIKYNFPKLEDLREFKDVLKDYNVIIDDYCEFENIENIAVFGNSHAVLKYNDVGKSYRVIAMHEANVRIISEGYAVVAVEGIGANIIVEKKDNSKVFINER